MRSYIDSSFATAADSTNKVEIGEKVYNKVWTDNTLPAAINYHVTDCTAYETYDATSGTGSGTSYTIFDVSFDLYPELWGQKSSGIDSITPF